MKRKTYIIEVYVQFYLEDSSELILIITNEEMNFLYIPNVFDSCME